MGRAGAGSTLSSIAARQRQLAATRKQLTGDTGAPAGGRARGNVPPPPQAPAEPSGDDSRQQMLTQADEFLQQRGAQARGQVPRTREPVVQRVSTRPGPNDTLADRVDALGAAKRPVETQFFRLAGREGTPRELALFNARLTLERQLNRPPTETELRMWIARPSSIGPITNPVVERGAPGAGGQ